MKSQEINLYWHNYKFFPYEKRFAVREVRSLLDPKLVKEFEDRILISGLKNSESIKKLVYFSHAEIAQKIFPTTQYHFENGSGNVVRHKRQNTRYSVHGLHEYKGKFNPQVVRSLFNIYNVKASDKVLDPFCGSGTTLVESAHDGISARGTDINPLAVFIANAKIGALNISAEKITYYKELLFTIDFSKVSNVNLEENERIKYLRSWFPEETLAQIELLKSEVLKLEEPIRNVFLVIISNLLRDYSLQEPSDLRIRRRFSPFPEISLIEQLKLSIDSFAQNLQEFQTRFHPVDSMNKAINLDIKYSRNSSEFSESEVFDFAITSPPYATALPYIDTQRLSLVWLSLVSAKEIKSLESDLIGSREFKTKSEQDSWLSDLLENKYNLPDAICDLCTALYAKLEITDGFRKKALPSLLYRYFYDMQQAFKEVHRLLKPEKYFCLIVGHNHTRIGGKRTDIDTPRLLSLVGEKIGFSVYEILELDAYQRYGLNSGNAVQKESLIVFKK
ncbi:MAG: DNA methylase [Flavobacterium sp.]|nr:MAG: DNA methylase [Flavobacterium sp.]